MSKTFDLVVRNAYLAEPNKIMDIAISGEKIVRISKKVEGKGEEEIDARGNFVSPGFIDSHMHMDKALTATGERVPKYNELSYDRDRCIKWGLEFYGSASAKDVERNVLELAQMAVVNGTLYIRTHVDVDRVALTKATEGVIAAREKLKDLVDIQIVAFAQSGFLCDPKSENLVKKCIDMGADLIGGLDPASLNNNIEGTFDTWFKIARDCDVDIDSHIMDRSTLGLYTLDRLSAKTIEYGYIGKVTASHSYSLADASGQDLNYLIPKFKKAGLRFVTCYTSTFPSMPVKRLLKDGVNMALASDNVRDFWIIQGNADLLQGALVNSFKLSLFDQENMMSTNEGLYLLWKMITEEGAKVLGIEKDYGIEEGKKADIIIFDAPSPQWAIITQAKKLYVIKNGKVVAMNGEILPAFKKSL